MKAFPIDRWEVHEIFSLTILRHLRDTSAWFAVRNYFPIKFHQNSIIMQSVLMNRCYTKAVSNILWNFSMKNLKHELIIYEDITLITSH